MAELGWPGPSVHVDLGFHGNKHQRESIYPVHRICLCFMGSEPRSEGQIHMGWLPGAMRHCGPLWIQSNTLVIRGTKKNKAGGRESVESDSVVISGVKVSMILCEGQTVDPVQEGRGQVDGRGEGSSHMGSMCKGPEWEPRGGQYGWRD